MSKSTTKPSQTGRPDTSHSSQHSNKNRTRAGANTGTKKQPRPPARPSPSGSGNRTRPADRGRPGGAKPRSGGSTTRFRTRHPMLTALVPVAIVVIAVGTMIAIKASGSSGPSQAGSSHLSAGGAGGTTDPGTTALSAGVLASLTVPASTLDAVGTPGSVVPPERVGGHGAVARGADGKPLITYVGAEYCPYCAAERWALAVALSRFGTLSKLSGTHSASDDVYPNTQTLSFYRSSYTSPYVDFRAVEEATNQKSGDTYQALQTPTAAESSLLTTYDPAGSIPFLDIANKYVVTGASFSPQVLQGLSRDQIAAQLSDPSSPVAQAIDGAANYITAAISTVTGNQPTSVANSTVIAAIAKELGA
jgi:uncharacterized protein DUF929